MSTTCRLLMILLFVATSASPAVSQDMAGDFLHLGFGARSLALGDALTVLADGPEAVYWNPANLARIRSTELMAMHAERFASAVSHDNVALVIPSLDKNGGGLGIGLIRVAVDDIPRTANLDWLDFGADGRPNTGDEGEGDNEWTPGERVIYDASKLKFGSDTQTALLIAYGTPLSPALDVGVSAKVIRQVVGSAKSFGMGLDIGASLRITNSYRIGLRFGDVGGTPIWWDTGRRERVRSSLWVGHAYETSLNPVSAVIRVAMEGRYYDLGMDRMGSEESRLLSFGSEIVFLDAIKARFGVREGDFGAGAGLRFRALSADYAYIGHSELGNSHRVALRWCLGQEIER